MAVNVQPTCFYTADGQNDLVLHNGGGDGKLHGRKGSTFDEAVPRDSIKSDGTFNYTGALGTFNNVKVRHHN